MSGRSWALTPAVHRYLLDSSLREPDVLRRLRETTAKMPEARMQISPEQGQLMALLVEMLGARQTIEIGTFTGYSALVVARALPDDGRVVACDVQSDFVDVGRPFWEEAGVASKIDVRIGDAVQTLRSLREEGGDGQFDFAFIDADKGNYSTYYEQCLALVRKGGLIAVDNVLWGGSVADPSDTKPTTEAIRALNRRMHADEQVSVSMIPIGDGLYLARKRS